MARQSADMALATRSELMLVACAMAANCKPKPVSLAACTPACADSKRRLLHVHGAAHIGSAKSCCHLGCTAHQAWQPAELVQEAAAGCRLAFQPSAPRCEPSRAQAAPVPTTVARVATQNATNTAPVDWMMLHTMLSQLGLGRWAPVA